jgi:hypothetical protein
VPENPYVCMETLPENSCDYEWPARESYLYFRKPCLRMVVKLFGIFCSAVGADHRLRVPAAGEAGAPPPRRPREAAQGDCP